MLGFQPITQESLQSVVPFLSGNGAHFCDFCPANLFSWAGYFYQAFAVEEDVLYLQLLTEDGGIAYAVPMGKGDLKHALRRLYDHATAKGAPLILSLVSADDLPLLREVFGELTHASSESQWCDYVYDAAKMAAYEGADYAKQRNHYRRFCRLYPHHRIEVLSPSHLPAINAFLEQFPVRRGKTDAFALEEVERTEQALAHMDSLGLFGIVLYAEDELVGFSAGSRIGDMLFVNFEKADTSFDGAYQVLVKEFASRFTDPSVRFINREEDCGDEGLRKSKLAYHPITLLAKYTVEIP